MLDTLLFGALPYVAIVLFLVVSIQRYRRNPFSFSSLSSQFLETRRLFWGSVPFHVGILAVFLGHLTGFLFPRGLVLWNRLPVRLLVFEVTGLAFALLTLVGLAGLLARRAASPRLRVNTSGADLLVLAMLLFQVLTGLDIALRLRWGSTWYAEALVPVPALDSPAAARCRAHGGDVPVREAARGGSLRVLRRFQLHAPRPRPGRARPVPLAPAAGGHLEPAAKVGLRWSTSIRPTSAW